MATLEKVMQMKGQGMSENQIVQTLRQEGVPPREIEESLSQSKIKYAVDSNPTESNPPQQENMNNLPQESGNYNQNYSRSSFQGDQEEAMVPSPDDTSQVQSTTQNYYPEYQPGAQSMYQEYQPQQPFDIETINEMLEQAIEEKNESLKKQISSFTRFKEDALIEIDKINSRLQKIENTISDLQISILRKIGEYGNDIHTIAREMQTTQDTFSKIIDPLTDNIRELRDITGSMKPTQHAQNTNSSNPEPRERQSKPKDGFENFLR